MWRDKWLNVVFCIENIAKTYWSAYSQGLQLPTVLVFKMYLDPVDFPFPLNGVSLFEIQLFKSVEVKKTFSPPLGVF